MSENAASATAAVVESGSGGTGVGRFRGVRMRKWGKWVAEVRLPNSRERIWLGSYDTQDRAARAYDAAVFCLRGPGARFNFPDDPPAIPSAGSLTPAQIQVAASRFAHAKDGGDHHAPAMPLAMQGVRDREGAAGGLAIDHDAEQSSSNWPVTLADSFMDAEEDSDHLGALGPAFGGYSEVDGGIFYAGNHQKAGDEEVDIDDDEGGTFYQPSGPLWNF